MIRDGPGPGISREPASEYGARRAAYDIKKLRGKDMVQKVGASRRYQPLPQGLRALTALVVLREKVIRPLLAASTRPQLHSKLSNPTPIDQHYENLRVGMHGLFVDNGTYVNSKGQTVKRPENCSIAPKGATAQCRDGTYSFSQSRRGTCSHHGGVAK